MGVVGDVVEPDGRSRMGCAADRGGPVGQCCDARALSGKHDAAMHPKVPVARSRRSAKVCEDLLQTAVRACDRAGTWDRPADVWVQQRAQRAVTIESSGRFGVDLRVCQCLSEDGANEVASRRGVGGGREAGGAHLGADRLRQRNQSRQGADHHGQLHDEAIGVESQQVQPLEFTIP